MYSVEEIPIEYIDYTWSHPRFGGNQDRILQWHKKMETLLISGESSGDDSWSIHKEDQIRIVYQSMRDIGMVDPIIIGLKEKPYYVIYGNQRLCCSRVLKKLTMLCRVTKLSWEKEANQILELYPNKFNYNEEK